MFTSERVNHAAKCYSMLYDRKYIYADDTAMIVSDKWFTVVEQTLSENLDKLREYFYNWLLKLNSTKIVCSTFHYNNRLADYELSITTMGDRILFDQTKKYLGFTFDHTLLPPTLTEQCSKSKHMLQSTKETCQQPLASQLHKYCCPIWCQSHHCKKSQQWVVSIGWRLHQIHSYSTAANLIWNWTCRYQMKQEHSESLYTCSGKHLHFSPGCNISTCKC